MTSESPSSQWPEPEELEMPGGLRCSRQTGFRSHQAPGLWAQRKGRQGGSAVVCQFMKRVAAELGIWMKQESCPPG